MELGGGGGGIGNKNFNGGGDGGDDDGDDDDYFGEDDGDDDGDNKGLFGRRLAVPEVRRCALWCIEAGRVRRVLGLKQALDDHLSDTFTDLLWCSLSRCLIGSMLKLSYKSGSGRSATCLQEYGRLLNWCVHRNCSSFLLSQT